MATIVNAGDQEQRLSCDVPVCKRRRAERHQENGRFLCTVRWDTTDEVTVTVICAECGGTHTVTLHRPA